MGVERCDAGVPEALREALPPPEGRSCVVPGAGTRRAIRMDCGARDQLDSSVTRLGGGPPTALPQVTSLLPLLTGRARHVPQGQGSGPPGGPAPLLPVLSPGVFWVLVTKGP